MFFFFFFFAAQRSVIFAAARMKTLANMCLFLSSSFPLSLSHAHFLCVRVRGSIIPGLFLLSNRFGKFIFGAFNSFQSMTKISRTEISNVGMRFAQPFARLFLLCVSRFRIDHLSIRAHRLSTFRLFDAKISDVRLQIIRRYCLIFTAKTCSDIHFV